MDGECFLEMATEIVGASEDTVGSTEGEETVGVDFFETDGEFFGSGANHLRKEETGEVVSDYDGGIGSERFEEAASLPSGGLYIRIVGNFALCAGAGVVGHTVDDEMVKTIAGPLVTAAEGFEYQERFVESAGVFESPVEREIMGEAASGDHPVENIFSGGADGGIVALTNADSGNRGQSGLPEFFAERALGQA